MPELFLEVAFFGALSLLASALSSINSVFLICVEHSCDPIK